MRLRKGIGSRNRVRQSILLFVHIDTTDLPEEKLHVLAVTLRVLLRPGVSHSKIEIAVRAKLDAAATVVLGHADHLQHPARRLTRITPEIRCCLSLDQHCGNLVFLKDLVLEIILPVLTKLWMECQAEQAIGSAFVKQLLRQIDEQRFLVTLSALFEQPDFAGLMNDDKGVAQARNLSEPDESRPHITGLVHEGVGKAKLLLEKRTQRQGLRQFGNDRWRR